MVGGSSEDGSQDEVIKVLKTLDLNGHTSDGDNKVDKDIPSLDCTIHDEQDNQVVRVGAESAPAMGHAESEALKRYFYGPGTEHQ